MPRILGLFGRPIPRLANRRLLRLVGGLLFIVAVTILFALAGNIPAGPSLSQYTSHKFPVSLPKFKDLKNPLSNSVFNPFRQPPHAPPRQKNDTFEESSWWADWKWLVPFSSSLTLDEDRSLLPPLAERPAIYCYYDVDAKKDSATKDAESELLLMWRMAWWAKGFKPIILTAAEAMNNPLYETLRHIELDAAMKNEVMRWFAWENMGGGLIAEYTLVPMGAYHDPLITYLRRGEYPSLTMWAKLDNALFAGSREQVSEFVKTFMESDAAKLKEVKELVLAAPQGSITIDTEPRSLASYSTTVLEKSYPKLAEVIKNEPVKGLQGLRKLINAHSHVMWQNVFSDGIAVLKPIPRHTTLAVEDAWELAHLLAACPDTPVAESCPPTYPDCTPCKGERNAKVTTPEHYNNASTIFTIGTVPHPYTLATLDNLREDIDVDWIRRDMMRDPWLTEATLDILPKDFGAGARIMRLKEAIAGPEHTGRSIWFTAEKKPPTDLEWHFGFTLPENKDIPPAPSTENASGDDGEPVAASSAERERERDLLMKAMAVGVSSAKEKMRVRDAIEAWNLGDTEAWKFARAFLARQAVERLAWEKEEAKYGQGAGSEGGRHTFDRWIDKLEDQLDRVRR